MRVLHIVGERGFSGGEDQLLHVVRALAAAGHENRFVLQPDAAFTPHAEAHGRVVATRSMGGSLDLGAARALGGLMRTAGADLVHLADSRAHKLGMLGGAGRGGRPPVVVTRRMDYPIKRPWLGRRLYGPRVAAIVAVSQAVADEITRIGVPPARVHVIHDGVDEAFADGLDGLRAQARADLGLPEDALVFLSLASLRPRKGQRDLIAAFADALSTHPEARLVLAGEGSDRAHLEAAAAALGDRVLLPGRLEARAALAAADVACVPSLREGLSVFSLEAQLAARPVVASRVGGLVESVAAGETGLLVPPGDRAALGAALASLATDPQRRAALGAAGRARVLAGFTARHMATKTVALYERLAAG